VSDNAGVIAPPPLIALGAIGIGFALEAIWPTVLPAREARIIAGIAIFALGFAAATWAFVAFHRAGTNVQTRLPSTNVVTRGPYRFSRNPIYLGMALGIVAVGIAAGSGWVTAMVLPFLAAIRFGVIAREERYLEGKFGAGYRDYQAQVRRWI